MSKQIKLVECPRTLDGLLRLYGRDMARFMLEGVVGSDVRWDYRVPGKNVHFDCYWFAKNEMPEPSLCFALNKEDPLEYAPDGFLISPATWDCAGSLRPGLLRLLSMVNPELVRSLGDKLEVKSILGQPSYDRENRQAIFRLTAATEVTHALLWLSLKNPQDSEKYQLFNPLEEALNGLVKMDRVYYVERPLGTGGDPRLFCIIEKTRLNLFPQEE